MTTFKALLSDQAPACRIKSLKLGWRSLIMAVITCAIISAMTAPAFAGVPVWQITSAGAPSTIAPGGEGTLEVTATNLGDVAAEGTASPITIHDVLPSGLTATAIAEGQEGIAMTCTLSSLSCTSEADIGPYESIVVEIKVTAADGPSRVINEATVSGGSARSATASGAMSISNAPPKFGFQQFELEPMNEDGTPDTQAGSHPFQLVTTFNLNQTYHSHNSLPEGPLPVGLTKDMRFITPPGLVGNPEVLPQCTEKQFSTFLSGPPNECPADTAIGVAVVTVTGLAHKPSALRQPLFNLVPGAGEPARFGFTVAGTLVYLDTSIRTGGDYGVTVSVNNVSQVLPIVSSQVTFWGVPGDPRHNNSRGWNCLGLPGTSCGGASESVSANQDETAFLTLPTSCEGAWKATLFGDSWQEPTTLSAPIEYTLHDATSSALALDGCNKLNFEPSLSVAPDGQAGSTPTGLAVGLHVPNQATLTPTGLAESDVRDTTVALPEGVQLNPAAADGLLSCSIEGVGLESAGPSTCPEDSKVATVEIKTPLLPNPLIGAAYLAEQNANPFGSLVALYIVAEDPVSGVRVKAAGRVIPNPVTGQLVSTFENTPPLPYEELSLKFFGTARAPLATPASCGTYTTTSSFEPWAGGAPATPSSSFEINSGPNGSPCATPLPFAPSLTAGTTSIQASGLTPFTLTMSREDGQQNLSTIQLHMPPGLSGTLSSVKLCGEPQAAQGTCGPESLIGHTIVSVGLGGDPFTVTGGQVFITGPYKGAPFGLSIVNPAKAGPFNLGTVVVRASIAVDLHTAALTVTSDPLPTMLDGIPLQIKHVNVAIDRPGFIFNPSDCSQLHITGTLGSDEGASSTVGVPFQVTNCATLAFKPKFAVSTSGKTSRAGGASLHVKLTYPTGPYDANIASVKVDLPKQLPSRLTTLQKACSAATFEANPANCPAASLIGSATATTPILPVPLSGPAYFVSHGGEAFPSLIIVLQGYGVTVDLVGSTFILRSGITSSTFKTVPDVPVGTFELTLPEGKYSALAADGNLCQSKLVMPTAFLAQNGIEIHQSTRIGVTGCPKAVRHERKKARKKKKNVRRRFTADAVTLHADARDPDQRVRRAGGAEAG
jgi:uncharacterized repeat protein (TIGR01451 family)